MAFKFRWWETTLIVWVLIMLFSGAAIMVAYTIAEIRGMVS